MDLISCHENADFDCLGSMVGARLLYPHAVMVFPAGQERGVREFFRKGGGQDLRFHRLKDLNLDEISRVILVDVRQSSRIGALAELIARPGVSLHLYDHHPSDLADLKGHQEIVACVGSTVTVVTQELKTRQIAPNASEATVMMLGLYEDTGSLLFSSTTEADYEAAAYLLSCGADLNQVADYLTQELSPQQVALLHELIENHRILDVGGVGVAIAHATIDHFVGDLASLVHKLKDIENLNALLVAVCMEERIFMVGRSRVPEVHVGHILEEFGGGGHAFAASATVRDITLVQVLERIPALLQKHVKPRWLARDLMSRSVRSLAPQTPLQDLRSFLTRYNINAAPVLDGKVLVGLISRQGAERALHHGLGQEPLSTYMVRDFVTVTPETPVEELQELTRQFNQRLLPVIEAGDLVGVVTRTDLLRYLLSSAKTGHWNGVPPSFGLGPFGAQRKNVGALLREQLPPWLLLLLEEIGTIGDDMGLQLYAVGGFVRDLLLHKKNLDVDIVVEGDGIAFAHEYARRRGCRVRYHRKFGTAVLIHEDGFKVDVVSARMEYYLAPGALPTVESAPIKLDLYRRDFSINTLAIALNGEHCGELIDFFNGQRDLKDRAIRILHNLSFVEDPTRMFRAVRFEKRLAFKVGRHSEQLMHSAVRMGVLDRIAGARVFNELGHIFCESSPYASMLRLEEFGLLRAVHPSLLLSEVTASLFQRAHKTMNWFELLYSGERFRASNILFLCLTWALDQDAMAGACARLDIQGRLRSLMLEDRAVVHLVLRWLEDLEPAGGPGARDLYRRLEHLELDALLYLMARLRSSRLRRLMSNYFVRSRHVRVLLTGEDLKKLNLLPGPLYTEIFERLKDAHLDGVLQSLEDEMEFVRSHYL